MNVDYSALKDTTYIDQYVECFRLLCVSESPLADINLSKHIFSFLQSPKRTTNQWIQYELLHGNTSGVVGKNAWSLRTMYRPNTAMAFGALCAGGHLTELEKHTYILHRWPCLTEVCFTSACTFDQLHIVMYLVTSCSAIPDATSLVHLVFANSVRSFEWLCEQDHIPERQYQTVDGILCAYDRPELNCIWTELMRSQGKRNKEMFVHGLDGGWRWVNFW